MGHYDSDYEADYHKQRAELARVAAMQLSLMETLYAALHAGPGIRGISQRHLDALQDMTNETRLRTIL